MTTTTFPIKPIALTGFTRYPGGHVDAPLCRREITLLVLSEASLRQRHNSDVAEVLRKVERHNSSFAGHSCDLVPMILSTVYILSPLDFIPEGILGLAGLRDDPIILLIFFFHVAAIYHPLLCYLHGGS